MKQVKISDVLHLAADRYLAVDQDDLWGQKVRFSCTAIDNALLELFSMSDENDKMYHRIIFGLQEMGLNTYTNGFKEFEDKYYTKGIGVETHTSEASQAARYAWLKFAAMIAEEQGL